MRKAMKVTVSSIAISVMIAGLLAGCSSSKPSDTVPEKAGSTSPAELGKEQIKLTMMTWEGADFTEEFKKDLKKFEQENPGITVEVLPSPLKDYTYKINELLSINKAPDVFYTGNDTELIFGKKGQLYDWTDKFKQDKDFSNQFYPGIIDNWLVDGKLYGVPGLLNTYGIFYNKKMFKDAGIPEPKNGWTYKEMLDAAKKLAKPGMFGFYDSQNDPFAFSNYSVSSGDAPFADSITDAKKVTVSNKFIDLVNMYREGVAGGYIAPFNQPTDQFAALFKQGKAPMFRGGQWFADDFIRNAEDLDFGYVASPIVDKPVATYDAVGFASPAKVANPEAVYKLIKFVSTQMYEQALVNFPVAPTAYAPSSKPYYNKLKESGHEDVGAAIDYMLKADKQPVRFMETWAAKATPFIDSTFKNVIDGKAPIGDLEKMETGINSVIASAN
ncbi:ABC transporter substrate-binding protein [Paenibacillus guangzhouensis]|uniref:ABC transporter substrate-binding protein n=1 Tax=Paenibacillus guangzhouensis TaxID=1473112 RepID=UPI0012669000|nr:sugar ABC transporter substrate-binding protein [Paenibacillus guangzhouensis]